jgi:hypothetical protein
MELLAVLRPKNGNIDPRIGIQTQGMGLAYIDNPDKDGPHLVNTWNSYIRISSDG